VLLRLVSLATVAAVLFCYGPTLTPRYSITENASYLCIRVRYDAQSELLLQLALPGHQGLPRIVAYKAFQPD
jgi:hypothetical protein